MNGVLIIDKPAGLTSHDVVARVRKTIGERRVGHSGTLDPFATGVLVILVGRATRLAQFLSGAEKEYEAVIRLGYATDTGDWTGVAIQGSQPQAQSTGRIREAEIEAGLASLRGEIEQTPPMYSAKKIAGRKLYELARRGEEVERRPVRVNIKEFEVIDCVGDLLTPTEDGYHDLAVRVVCSAGTYIRTLAEDFGKRLGLGAHLSSLRRTRAGRFKLAEACSLEELGERRDTKSLGAVLISPDAAVAHLPFVTVEGADMVRTLHGMDLRLDAGVDWPGGQAVRLCDGKGELVAVGIFDEVSKAVHPNVVISE